ncbi:MAG: TetR/AcrR family transcriptional regulator [Rhodospirillales bacterium]|nr:TetR/AcrR family transcriptional regulator [Rhodospirillales bacterium]
MPAPKHSPEVEENLVLEAAARVIENSSILDFKMSAIAAEAGISIGSVYKHVQCKEDVMIALVARTFAHALSNFQNIMEMPLTMPERCMASILPDFSICGLYPFDGHLQSLVSNDAVLVKGSPRWRNQMLQEQRNVEGHFYKHTEEAFDLGELRGTDKIATLDQLNLGMWALASGFSDISLLKSGFSLYGEDQTVASPYHPNSAQVHCIKAFINTFDWQTPLDEAGVRRAYDALEQSGFRKS